MTLKAFGLFGSLGPSLPSSVIFHHFPFSGLIETRTNPHAQPMVLNGIFRPRAVPGKQAYSAVSLRQKGLVVRCGSGFNLFRTLL
jgi:hypothetical protein